MPDSSLDPSKPRRASVGPRSAMLALAATALVGCESGGRSTAPPPLLGPQLQKLDEELVGKRIRTLLDFEHAADTAFVRTDHPSTAVGHTGDKGLLAHDSATVNISSLLFGSKLPGDWTLIGGYVRGTGGNVSATLLADGQEIARTTRDVPPNVYLFTGIDLTTERCRAALPLAKKIELKFEADRTFLLDDVLLVDNGRWLVDTLANASLGWAVKIQGLALVVRAARFGVSIPLAAGDGNGWVVDEASSLRVRLHDAAGRSDWTLLPDGRSIREGRLTTFAGVPGVTPSFTPAEIEVDPSTGRLDRETPGDENNDGYNEHRGAYQIVATTARMRLRIVPNGSAVESPVMEIRGLPMERPTVTVDGRLIEQVSRLSDGTLLILVPLRVERPVELTVSVSDEE